MVYYNDGKFKLELAKETECDEILKLIMAIANYEKMTSEVTATVESLHESIFVKNRATVILAKLNEKVIGYMLYFYNYSTFIGDANIYLEDLFLYEEYRHNGYGKIMLKTLANIAKKENVKRIDWVCLDWNKPSLDFYKSIGAKMLDVWKIHRLDVNAINELANK